MAKFKSNNLELRDGQKLILDSSKAKYISYDGSETLINTTLSGVTPTQDYHMATKAYVDQEVATVSGGTGVTDHGELTGLSDDDHSQYHNDTRGDARYYTQAQVDTISGSLSSEIDGDITTHTAISDAHHSRYTDAEAVSATASERTTLSGNLSSEIDTDITTHASSSDHDGRYYTENEVNTISGSLQSQIDTFEPLPTQSGNSGKYLTTDGSTASWATVSGSGGTPSFAHYRWLSEDSWPTLGSSADTLYTITLNDTVASGGSDISRSGSTITLQPGSYQVIATAAVWGDFPSPTVVLYDIDNTEVISAGLLSGQTTHINSFFTITEEIDVQFKLIHAASANLGLGGLESDYYTYSSYTYILFRCTFLKL